MHFQFGGERTDWTHDPDFSIQSLLCAGFTVQLFLLWLNMRVDWCTVIARASSGDCIYKLPRRLCHLVMFNKGIYGSCPFTNDIKSPTTLILNYDHVLFVCIVFCWIDIRISLIFKWAIVQFTFILLVRMNQDEYCLCLCVFGRGNIP